MDLQIISSGLLRMRSCSLVMCQQSECVMFAVIYLVKSAGRHPNLTLIWPQLMRAQTKSDVCLRTWGLFSSLHSTFMRITRSDMMAFSPGFFRWNEMHTAAFKCAIRHWYMRPSRIWDPTLFMGMVSLPEPDVSVWRSAILGLKAWSFTVKSQARTCVLCCDFELNEVQL